ncbi:sugar ABC transporter permease [Vallitalea longa]|uniref:Sugar ABC transporter permease n=1 Tax=Vallitalea longa TaxID=2936439 RepID=A0A9W6DCY5_9FIRM|nr:carbohydrate ABC transporter permease [Vallitalea longa]GKX27691.1 sugar ABC transporter permease [Vallitalea longa]
MKRKLLTGIKYLFLLLYALTCLYPFMWMLGTSLKTQQESLLDPISLFPKGGFQWHNYIDVWGKMDFFKYFMNSVIISLGVVIGVVIIYSMVGFALARLNFVGKKVIFFMYISLILVPGITVLIPLYINMTNLGLDNSYLGVILPLINGGAPFAVFLFTNYFKSVPKSLYEAAIIDGCNPFQIYRKIYFPLSMPAIGTIAVMNFIASWNGILWPMIIINNKNMFTLPMAIMYLDQSAFKQWNVLMAGSMFSVIPVIIIFIFLQKFYIQGLTSGSVKG